MLTKEQKQMRELEKVNKQIQQVSSDLEKNQNEITKAAVDGKEIDEKFYSEIQKDIAKMERLNKKHQEMLESMVEDAEVLTQ